MSEDLALRVEITASDHASAPIKSAEAAVVSLARTVERAGKIMSRAFGANFAKQLDALKPKIDGFGDDIAAVVELKGAIRDATAASAGLGKTRTSNRITEAAQLKSIRMAIAAHARASNDDLRTMARKWRIRSASQRAERAEAERIARDAAKQAASSARAAHRETQQRIRDVARLWRVRQASEAAELKQLEKIRSKRREIRQEAMRGARDAVAHSAHAARSMSHPYFSSPAFMAESTITAAMVGLKGVVDKAAAFDRSVTELAIRGGLSYVDATTQGDAARRNAAQYGVGAEHFVKIETEAISRGITPSIAKDLGPMVMKFAEATGQRPEEAADHTSEFVQQMISMRKVKGKDDIYRLLNVTAAVANKFGDPQKMMQAFESGLAERGSELGLSAKDSVTMAGLLNSMGARSGLYTTRALGLLSKGAPNWKGEWLEKIQSGNMADPRVRAFVQAPRSLGYGNMDQMVADAHGGNGMQGIARFFSSFRNIRDDATRKLVEEQLGFTEQVGGLIEGWINSPEKVARAIGVADRAYGEDPNGGKDGLSRGQAEYRKGLQYVEGVFDSVFQNMSISIEQVLKARVLKPFVGTWEKLSDWSITSLPHIVNDVIDGFVSGLGFRDIRGKGNVGALIDALSTSVKSIDWNNTGREVAEFFKGVGEGVRKISEDLRYAFGFFGKVTGDGTAEGIGKIATEMFALALAVHAFTPVLGVLTAITSSFAALRDIVVSMKALGALAAGGELAGGASAAAEGGLLAAGLATFPITLAAIGAGVTLGVIVTNWSAIKDFFVGSGAPEKPHADIGAGRITSDWLKQVPEALRHDPSTWAKWLPPSALQGMQFGPDAPKPSLWDRMFHRSAFDGGDDNGGLLQRISYQPSDSNDLVLDTMAGTEEGVRAIKANLDETNAILRAITAKDALDGVGFGDVDDRGGLPGAPNMRYGKGAGGQYRGTPGGGGSGGPGSTPSVGGGSGGSRSWRNNNPGNIEFGPYAKSMGAIGSDGRFAVFPSYDAGRKAQEHLLFDSKAYKDLTLGQAIGKWAPASENNVGAYLKAMGGDPNTRMSAFSAEQRSKLLDAMQAHEGWKVGTRKNTQLGGIAASGITPGGGNMGKVVDLALGMQGQGSGQAAAALGHYMHSGLWCADFVNGALAKMGVKGTNSAMANSFSNWGHHVGLGEVKKGDIVEQLRGGGIGHVGLATGEVQRDKAGNITGIGMVSGNWGNKVSHSFLKPGQIGDLRRANQAVEATARKVIESTKPSVIAPKVPTYGRPDPGQDATPAARISADASTGNHFEMHFHHQVADAREHARAVGRAIDEAMRYRTHEIYV